jgi:hypothetical protein
MVPCAEHAPAWPCFANPLIVRPPPLIRVHLQPRTRTSEERRCARGRGRPPGCLRGQDRRGEERTAFKEGGCGGVETGRRGYQSRSAAHRYARGRGRQPEITGMWGATGKEGGMERLKASERLLGEGAGGGSATYCSSAMFCKRTSNRWSSQEPLRSVPQQPSRLCAQKEYGHGCCGRALRFVF